MEFDRSKEQLTDYYSVESREGLAGFLEIYLLLVINYAKNFAIDLTDSAFEFDHLGFQVLNNKEFEKVTEKLLDYSEIIIDDKIHDRGNRVFEFDKPIEINKIIIPRIEIFEPKPGSDLDNLKPGIEHVAFKVDDVESFYNKCKETGVPIDKKANYGDSTFFKTVFFDLIEIEFRENNLGKK